MSSPYKPITSRSTIRFRWSSPLGIATIAIVAAIVGSFGWVATRPGQAAGSPSSDLPLAVSEPAGTPIADANGDGRLRVLFLGDSLVQRASDELTEIFTANGVEVEFRGYTATGLLTQLPEDGGATWWSGELNDSLATFGPDIVVIEACCNYDGTYTDPDTSALPADSEAHYDRWRQEAEALTSAATATGAAVYWVLSPSEAPTAGAPWPPTRVERFNEIYRSLGVALIDWRTVFYAAQKTSPEDLRDEDGVHLSSAGDRVIVAETWRVLTEPGE